MKKLKKKIVDWFFSLHVVKNFKLLKRKVIIISIIASIGCLLLLGLWKLFEIIF
jgi:hypothetical protein